MEDQNLTDNLERRFGSHAIDISHRARRWASSGTIEQRLEAKILFDDEVHE